jgi:diguanylate cyclase (GGDEF)-like protein
MSYLRSFRALLAVPTDNPELTRSQLMAFAKQVPLLYVILIANTIAIAATHVGSAPPILAIYVPALFCSICIVRLFVWRSLLRRSVSDAEAVAHLRTTIRLVAVIGVAFTFWGLSLYPYGDAYAQGHVAFYMSITVIGCIFCLMHLRPAALLLTAIVIVPFTLFFVSTGKPVFIAIAINFFLVSMVMIVILFTYYRDFADLIDSQKQLVAKQAETQRLSDENFQLANLDSLTGLASRRRFFAALGAKLERSTAGGARFCVGLVDLDGFKPVNDIYGHANGDRVIVEAARRLREVAGAPVFIARLGGDEFGLLIEGDTSDAELLRLGNALCQALQAPYELPGAIAQTSGSAGFASYPEAGRSAEQLFERADYALYFAKQNRRGAPVIFSREHETAIREVSVVEQALRTTDLADELSLAFQPIFDVEAGRTIAFEALARWSSPVLGVVSPAQFIKVAERSDLISRLTELLLGKALAAARSWPKDVRISFNLSTRDIASPDAVMRVIAVVARSGLDPRRIDFEITETAVMRDFDQACEALTALRRFGARISLDDFGTGYSSLSYVHRLPLDKIKIDRSFITEIETAAAGRDIIKTVADLCRNLKLGCVVEGTETAGQVAILRELGCSLMQGYLFGRPMPAANIAGHLMAERGRRNEAMLPLPQEKLTA